MSEAMKPHPQSPQKPLRAKLAPALVRPLPTPAERLRSPQSARIAKLRGRFPGGVGCSAELRQPWQTWGGASTLPHQATHPPHCRQSITSADESSMSLMRNQERFLKFSGSSAVSSRNGLQRIHATRVPSVQTFGVPRSPRPRPETGGPGETEEIAIAYFREFDYSALR